LPHLFDRFYRADQSRSTGNGRVGLGLAIVRSVVEQHGGTVAISSVVGNGMRVLVSFPKRSSRSTVQAPIPSR
jgi:signal transduction histidine kinase